MTGGPLGAAIRPAPRLAHRGKSTRRTVGTPGREKHVSSERDESVGAAPSTEVLDGLLAAQLAVAWAGEGGEEPRLGWWRTDMVAEFGGEDLFKRLLPHTWDWAALQTAREAARRRDAELRAQASDPDRMISLFHQGFTVDERLDERLLEHKGAGAAPPLALPSLDGLLTENWSREAFASWVGAHGPGEHQATPVGRLVKADAQDLDAVVRALVGALAPLQDQYPLPYLERGK